MKSIETFKNILLNHNLDKLDKKTIIKLINLYKDLSKLNIIEEIITIANKENDKFLKELIDIKINSIITDLSTKKYIKKEEGNDFSVYYYESTIRLYIKESLSKEYFKKLILKLEFKHTYIIMKKIKYDFNINDLNEINYLYTNANDSHVLLSKNIINNTKKIKKKSI